MSEFEFTMIREELFTVKAQDEEEAERIAYTILERIQRANTKSPAYSGIWLASEFRKL